MRRASPKSPKGQEGHLPVFDELEPLKLHRGGMSFKTRLHACRTSEPVKEFNWIRLR
jgi:hypothetical protein